LAPRRRCRRGAERHAQALAAATVLVAVPVTYGVHAVATMPPAAVRHAQTGDDHYREGRYDAAIKAFTASLEADPQQPEVLFKRGRAYLKAGDDHYRVGRYDAAIKAFTASLEADPQQPEVLFKRGRAYLKDGKIQRALEDLRDRTLVDHPRALASCGYIYSGEEKTSHEQAIDYYKAAMD